MHHVSLDGDWQLTYFREGEYAVRHPDDLAAAGAPAVTAQVPGNVELDLQHAGVIPEPFYAGNIRRLRPFEFYEWWYTREFDVPAAPEGHGWRIVFDGLDTVATIWINGHEAGPVAQHAGGAFLGRDRPAAA